MSKAVEKKKINKISILDAMRKLSFVIDRNDELQAEGIKPASVNIIGAKGLGKTDMAAQLATRHRKGFFKLNMTMLSEEGDLIGTPETRYLMVKAKEGGPALQRWVDKHSISAFLEKGFVTGNKSSMFYNPPYWATQQHENGIILLLDDFNRAEPFFLQATMELIDRQEYLGWKMPPKCTILLTSNPSDEDYIVNETDKAQNTRAGKVYVEFDAKAWAIWAENRVNDSFVNFILSHPEVADDMSPTPIRLWTKLFDQLSKIVNLESERSLVSDIAGIFVEPEHAVALTTYISSKMHLLPDHRGLYDSNRVDDTIREYKAIMRDRPDIAGIIQSRFIATILFTHENEAKPFTAERKNLIEKVIDSNIFTEDVAYALVYMLYNYDTLKYAKILTSAVLSKKLN